MLQARRFLKAFAFFWCGDHCTIMSELLQHLVVVNLARRWPDSLGCQAQGIGALLT